MACAALRQHHPHPHPYNRPHLTAASSPPQPPPLCKFWLRGRCNRGHRCAFSHHSPTAMATAVANEEEEEEQRPFYNWRRRSRKAPPLADQDRDRDRDRDREPHVEAEKASESILPAPPLPEVSPPSFAAEDTSSAAAIGVSAANWPALVVTNGDGSVGVMDGNDLGKTCGIHKAHAPITCLANAPLHRGLLLLGFASGEIAVMLCGDGMRHIHTIPGPSQSCGKVLCLASARTRHHSLLLIAGYENGAILCWAHDPHSTTLYFSELCVLRYPGAASVLSMDISQDGVGDQVAEHPFLYSASADGSITVWDLDSMCVWQVLQSAVPVTKILAAGRYLFTGSSDGSIRAWGPSAAVVSEEDGTSQLKKKMELLYTQPCPRQAATAVVDLSCQAMEGDNHILFAAYRDHTVSMWELPSFKELDVLRVSFGIHAMDVARTSPTAGVYAVIVLGGYGGNVFSMPILRRCQSTQ